MSELNQEVPTQDVSPAQETQETASPEPEAKPETPEEQTKRALSGVQRRINELTRERHEERERREQAERRALDTGTGTMPTLTTLYHGTDYTGALAENGWERKLAFYPLRLPNDQLPYLYA